MKKINIFVIVFFAVILTSIIVLSSINNSSDNKKTQQQTRITTEVRIDSVKTENEFEKKLKNNKKIFLKYWANMTYEEFNEVSEILAKEGTIQKNGLDYQMNINGNLVKILPSDEIYYTHSKLINKSDKKYQGIVLKSINDVIYNTYKEKYKLKELIYRNRFNGLIVQENPHYYNYDSSDNFFDLNTIKTVYGHDVIDLNSFIDELNDKSKFHSTQDLDYLKEKTYLAPRKQIIKNKDNVIIITEAYSNYKKHTIEDSLYYIYVYEKKSIHDKYSEIIKSTPNRIKIEPLSSDILIFYTSIENYNQIENEETENLNRINKERNAFEKQGKDNINAI